MKLISILRSGALVALLFVPVLRAQHPPVDGQAAHQPSPYAPYEFLLGEWDVGSEGKAPSLVMRMRWGGTARGYLFYSASLLLPGGKEDLHFEGILIWNAVEKNLDMLLTLDPVRGTTLEKGSMFLAPDGKVVREITAIGPQAVRGPDGKPTAGKATFRQTFESLDRDTVRTVVLRQTADGWTPTFPGSDNLIMRRRPSGTPH